MKGIKRGNKKFLWLRRNLLCRVALLASRAPHCHVLPMFLRLCRRLLRLFDVFQALRSQIFAVF